MSIKYFDSEGRIENRNATTGFHLCMTGFEFAESHPSHATMIYDWGIVAPLDAPMALPVGSTSSLWVESLKVWIPTSLVSRPS